MFLGLIYVVQMGTSLVFIANILLCTYTIHWLNLFNILTTMSKASLLTFHISFCKHGFSLVYIGWKCFTGLYGQSMFNFIIDFKHTCII